MENVLRVAVLAAGAKLLGEVISGIGCGRRADAVMCKCGSEMKSRGLREKSLLTVLGMTTFTRSMYECPECGATRYPGDEELDIVGTTRSPGLRRLMARAGGRESFKEGSDDLKVYAGIEVSAKDVERVSEKAGGEMERWLLAERTALAGEPEPERRQNTIPVLYVSYDGTGVPMVPKEVEGRKGKQPDGSAKTREAKLGCVFTQTTTDDEGFPVRDPGSTTFVGAIEGAETFGVRIYAEAVRRGLYKAEKVVVIGDGARWVSGIAAMHFPMAIRIIDLYHAREHVTNLCKLVSGTDDQKTTALRIRWWKDLDASNVEKIIREAQDQLPKNVDARKNVEREIGYLEGNKENMRYAAYRKQGLFVGSGVVEAGCKTVVGRRLKQSGMEWSVRGANDILAVRCTMLSGRFNEFWKLRCA
jgi:hypothetical protein